MSDYSKKYYQDHKEKMNAQVKEWQLTHPEQHRENCNQWKEKHPEYRLYVGAKHRAAKRGLEFTLTLGDIRIPECCPILGIPLSNHLGVGRQQSGISIDRKDSSKGYTPDNIQVISDLANRMKQEATPEQLLTFARSILRIYGES